MTPFGPDLGQRVRLTDAEKFTIRQIYDREQQDGPITGNLAGYIALLHLCGDEALGNDPLSRIEVSSWTVWHSAGLTLHPELKREGDAIVCRRLHTRIQRRRRHGLNQSSRAGLEEAAAVVSGREILLTSSSSRDCNIRLSNRNATKRARLM